jgi:Asp-tRNA(Asn)/Glu-tRNA(Gln) amidotransferase B subunit
MKIKSADWNKTQQNKTKQNKTKQNKTKQNKTKQNKTKQNKTKQNHRDSNFFADSRPICVYYRRKKILSLRHNCFETK